MFLFLFIYLFIYLFTFTNAVSDEQEEPQTTSGKDEQYNEQKLHESI